MEILEPFGVEVVTKGREEWVNWDLLIIRKRDYQAIYDNLEKLIDNFRYFQPLTVDFRGLVPKESYSHYVTDESRLERFFKQLLDRLPEEFDYYVSMRLSEEFEYARNCFVQSLFTKTTAHTNELLARLDLIITLLVLKPVGLIYSDIYL